MPLIRRSLVRSVSNDLTAGMVVFLVALPLCLGVALASGAPPVSGLIAGIVGGVVIGFLSGSHTSVSGPAAGLTAVVLAHITALGSFEAFLLAVIIAGLIQVALGLLRVGYIAAFFPTSVIKGLLAAIGVILVLKQLPHVLGHDTDPEGEMSFIQPDAENTFSEFVSMINDMHPGAASIGLLSILILIVWELVPWLKKRHLPPQLVVVVVGVGLSWLFTRLGSPWAIESNHLVEVPVASEAVDFFRLLHRPAFEQWKSPAVYAAGLTIALVASLETLLNLEGTDRLDPQRRTSPPNRELLAQGIGNVFAGLCGGIPITSVIVRSSVNINAGARTRLAAIVHGALLLACVVLLPDYLNQIPVSCLAAILFVTGAKLASPALMKQMWSEGRYQFLPFTITLLAIVLTDLVTGVLIGLMTSVAFILNSNRRRPIRRIVEKHLNGDVLRIELANQVSFLNRASLEQALDEVPRGTHLLLDARNTNYIDPDILSLIVDYKNRTAPARGVQVSVRGFREKYQLQDEILYVDYSTRELQSRVTPEQVLQLLREGNERFRTGRLLSHDLGRQLHATAEGQHPLAIVLSCIDSRTPSELIFDLGLGDIFSVRIAGNVTSPKVLGSLEYGCAVAGAKLVLVVGHTRCGAVTAAVEAAQKGQSAGLLAGCDHLDPIVADIQQSIDANRLRVAEHDNVGKRRAFVDEVARANVRRSVRQILEVSVAIRRLVEHKQIAVVGAMYDVVSGNIEFLPCPTSESEIRFPT